MPVACDTQNVIGIPILEIKRGVKQRKDETPVNKKQ